MKKVFFCIAALASPPFFATVDTVQAGIMKINVTDEFWLKDAQQLAYKVVTQSANWWWCRISNKLLAIQGACCMDIKGKGVHSFTDPKEVISSLIDIAKAFATMETSHPDWNQEGQAFVRPLDVLRWAITYTFYETSEPDLPASKIDNAEEYVKKICVVEKITLRKTAAR
jgi:hypothetical protein